MLCDFVSEHRDGLIVRCAAMVARRTHLGGTNAG